LAGTTANKVSGQLIDWDFNWGLEIKLNGTKGRAFFNNISSIYLNDFGYKIGDAVIRLDELQASDPKILITDHHDQGDCANGDPAPNHEPYNVIVVAADTNNPNPLPEPSALALLGLGIMDMWYRHKKSA
jgi:hypothetical protein